MVGHSDQNRFVEKSQFRPRMVLRTNLQALMDLKGGPNSQGELHRKSGVAQATIGRILSKGGNNARIETIDKLAKAYGLEGWQLLVAGMDPSNPPVLQAVSKEERDLYQRLRQLAAEFSTPKQ